MDNFITWLNTEIEDLKTTGGNNLFMQGKLSEAIRIREMFKESTEWISVEDRLPETDDYIMLSFENFSLPAIGRYEVDDDGNRAFYQGDDDRSCVSFGLFVNAWMELPKRYEG